jgi:hypothetical protein
MKFISSAADGSIAFFEQHLREAWQSKFKTDIPQHFLSSSVIVAIPVT